MSLLSLPVLLGTALAVLIGVALGLMGGGGSILTVPILVYVVGMSAHQAIAVSLIVVGATAVAALLPHARAGRVQWATGALFGVTSMVGAYGAGQVAHYIPDAVLLIVFGALMLTTAIAMMRGGGKLTTTDAPPRSWHELPLLQISVQGLGVGALSGLVGAGGGFLIVPALVLLGKLPMRVAVGTSLFVIAMNSSAGLAAHLQTIEVDWPVALMMTGASIAGSLLGSTLAGRIPEALLKRGFAWFVIVIGVFVLTREVPAAFGIELERGVAWGILIGASTAVLVMATVDLARRIREMGAEQHHHA